MSVTMNTLSGGSVEIDAAAFATTIEGSVIAPGDSGYDEARTIWNAMIDKRPGLIVQCAGAPDTMACVNFAREHDLLVSVRGAGHNIAGSSLSDGGLLIDHSLLRSVNVDTDARTVTVGPGATLGDVDAATLDSGLAVPVGINSTTGIAGLTLGGGFGWLSRKHGLTIDALLSGANAAQLPNPPTARAKIASPATTGPRALTLRRGGDVGRSVDGKLGSDIVRVMATPRAWASA